MASPAESIQYMLTALQRPSRRLTTIELAFLAEMDRWFHAHGDLPDSMFDSLSRLFSEATD